MRVAVMQPYLLPYLGYFGLISKVDAFVVFDSVQYIRRGWVNRNRLPAADGQDWFYFNVPVKSAPRSTAIQDIQVSYDEDWQERLRRTIVQAYGKAPSFEAVMPLLEPLWQKEERLLPMLEGTLRSVSGYLGLHPRWIRSSELAAADPALAALHGEQLILGICARLGATEYWNLPGGRELYQPGTFEERGMALRFLPPLDLEKWKGEFPFLSDFSIIDVLMHAPAGQAQAMLGRVFEQ